MKVEARTRRNDIATPALFMVAVLLVIVFLVISVANQNKAPSVKNGATTSEVESYAYKLLSTDNGTNAIGYSEAVAYYASQISASTDKEQKFNLMLDFAIFYGETGDPAAGLQVLGDIDINTIPLDARYYLYSTYIYLFERQGDEESVAEYRKKIESEGINEYFAGLDDGTITPEPITSDDDSDGETEDEYDSSENNSANLFDDEAL